MLHAVSGPYGLDDGQSSYPWQVIGKWAWHREGANLSGLSYKYYAINVDQAADEVSRPAVVDNRSNPFAVSHGHLGRACPSPVVIFSLVYPGPLHYLPFTLSYRAGRF